MKKALLFLFMLSCFTGCKKFSDGPLISFRSVKKRIEGTWKVDKFFINGADSTAEFNAKLGCEIQITGTKDPQHPTWNYVYLINCITGKSLTGEWMYTAGSDGLGMGFFQDSTFINGIGPLRSGGGDSWLILRLTYKEFNLGTNDSGAWGHPLYTPYIINLKKQ